MLSRELLVYDYSFLPSNNLALFSPPLAAYSTGRGRSTPSI